MRSTGPTVRTHHGTYVRIVPSTYSAQPGRPPVEPAGADDHWNRPKGGDAGAGARAGPHACEDCGMAIEIRAADIAVELDRSIDNTVAPECLYFKSFLR